MIEEGKLKILCPYCNAVWKGRMEADFYDTLGCDTCGSVIEGVIEIYCSNCDKLIYKKEGYNSDFI